MKQEAALPSLDINIEYVGKTDRKLGRGRGDTLGRAPNTLSLGKRNQNISADCHQQKLD